MKRYCYLNGKIIPLEKAAISPYDLGVLRGYGVFDMMVTVNGKPFMLDDHWKRLQNSAKGLRLKIPVSKEKYENIIRKLLQVNNFRELIIRTVLTGGESPDGFTLAGKETFYILIEKFIPLSKEILKKGVNVITLEYMRDCPKMKTTNYVAAIRNYELRIRKQALEIIYTNKNNALEASTSNFFIVKNNVLITPNDGVLFGVTRKIAMKLASQKGFKVKERKVNIKELYSADEVFLTATNKNIVPVVKVNNKKIRLGKPGEITELLMKEFENFVKKY